MINTRIQTFIYLVVYSSVIHFSSFCGSISRYALLYHVSTKALPVYIIFRQNPPLACCQAPLANLKLPYLSDVWVNTKTVSHSVNWLLVDRSKTLTHWARDKMAVITHCMKIYECRLKFHRSLFLRVQLTISQHWFRLWLGAGQATSHYLKQWWLV